MTRWDIATAQDVAMRLSVPLKFAGEILERDMIEKATSRRQLRKLLPAEGTRNEEVWNQKMGKLERRDILAKFGHESLKWLGNFVPLTEAGETALMAQISLVETVAFAEMDLDELRVWRPLSPTGRYFVNSRLGGEELKLVDTAPDYVSLRRLHLVTDIGKGARIDAMEPMEIVLIASLTLNMLRIFQPKTDGGREAREGKLIANATTKRELCSVKTSSCQTRHEKMGKLAVFETEEICRTDSTALLRRMCPITNAGKQARIARLEIIEPIEIEAIPAEDVARIEAYSPKTAAGERTRDWRLRQVDMELIDQCENLETLGRVKPYTGLGCKEWVLRAAKMVQDERLAAEKKLEEKK